MSYRCEKLVKYGSNTLTLAECTCYPTHGEYLVVKWARVRLIPFLKIFPITIKNDLNSLRWILHLLMPSRLAPWYLRLSRFEFHVVQRPDDIHQVADKLFPIATNGKDKMYRDDTLLVSMMYPTTRTLFPTLRAT